MRRECKCRFTLTEDTDRAIYQKIRDQIVRLIAASELVEGDPLPSVRQMAEEIGVNMHTVNKAYALLAEEGFVTVTRCRGAVISLSDDRERAMEALRKKLEVTMAEAVCRNITREEVCALVEELYGAYQIS